MLLLHMTPHKLFLLIFHITLSQIFLFLLAAEEKFGFPICIQLQEPLDRQHQRDSCRDGRRGRMRDVRCIRPAWQSRSMFKGKCSLLTAKKTEPKDRVVGNPSWDFDLIEPLLPLPFSPFSPVNDKSGKYRFDVKWGPPD